MVVKVAKALPHGLLPHVRVVVLSRHLGYSSL